MDFQAAYLSAEAAVKIAQGIFALKSDVERNRAVFEIQRNVAETQRALLVAEQENLTRLKQVDALEKEIVRLKDWTAKKQDYQLEQIDRDTFAYVAKPGMENGEPRHWLCATCYQDAKPSILQPAGTEQGGGGQGMQTKWKCGVCANVVLTSSRRHPDQPYPPVQG